MEQGTRGEACRSIKAGRLQAALMIAGRLYIPLRTCKRPESKIVAQDGLVSGDTAEYAWCANRQGHGC
jgi:hypothetical protein